MKKTIAILLLFVVILGFACAENDMQEYKIESLGCSILCPSSWDVFYNGMPDYLLNSYELSESDVKELLLSSGTEFIGFDDDVQMEAYKTPAALTMRLREKNEEFLTGFLYTFIPSTEANLGVPITSHELVKGDNNTYIRYEFCIGTDAEKDNVICYYTCADGYIYEFYFFCGNSIENKEDELIRTIMDYMLWE